MQASPGKKIYFLSDFHLGAPNQKESLEREKIIVRFLDSIKTKTACLFIVGDLFDFWYEYSKVIPRGYVRILGKLAELADSGIPINFFVGNHDMWMKNYFQTELGVSVFYEPEEFTLNGKRFFIGHGDGLGPSDRGYKIMKKIFRNPFCQWLFGVLPPYLGMGLADYFSRKSRAATGSTEEQFLGEDREWLLSFSREVLEKKEIDYFVFGHRHLPIDYRITQRSRYINLGDWMSAYTYAEFDGETLDLLSFLGKENKIYKNH